MVEFCERDSGVTVTLSIQSFARRPKSCSFFHQQICMIVVCCYCALPKRRQAREKEIYSALTRPHLSPPPTCLPSPRLPSFPLRHPLIDPRLVSRHSAERPRLVRHQTAPEARHRQLPLGNGELGGEGVDSVVREHVRARSARRRRRSVLDSRLDVPRSF